MIHDLFSILLNEINIVKYSKHSFKQFYCLKLVYGKLWTFWATETCLWQDGLYRGIYRPLSETTGPAQGRN